jgi:AsmA protein
MGKLFKILGWLLGVILLLVIAAAIILPLVFDPNDFKDEIVAQVEEQTGRTLQIEGDLKLSVIPWLGLETGAVSLGNAEGFGDEPFAAADAIAVRVKLMPLLSSELEVDTVGIDGLVLNLAKAKDGRTNWDDLATEQESKPQEPAQAGPEDGGLKRLAINGIDISDGRVTWDDRQSGQRYEIDQIKLNTGSIVPGKPVALDMGLVLKSSDPELNAALDMGGTIEVDQDADTLRIDALKLTVDAQGAALPQGSLRAQLQTGLVLKLDGSSLQLNALKLDSGDLHLSGDLQGANLNAQPAFSGSLKLAELNFRDWISSQGMAVPETADPKALTRLSADVSLNAKGSTTNIDKLALVLDDTNINGKASLKGDAVGFTLNVDAIDLDRYLPPPEEGGEEGAAASAGDGSAAAEEELFPIETLRGLNLNGVLNIQRLTINKLLAEGVKVTVKAGGGKLQMQQQVSSFYQGSYTGQTNINVQGKTPVLKIRSALSGIQAGPLLKDMTGDDKLTGKGRFNAELTASGNSTDAVKRSLGGNLNFRFEDGAVKGINLAQKIRELKALTDGKKAADADEPLQTDFSELTGSGVITRGVLSNKDLLAKSPYLRVQGDGTVNLVNEKTKYNLRTVLVNTSKGQGGKELASLEGVTIPVRVSGRYSDPKYSINWGEVLVDSQKDKLKEKLEKSLLKKLQKDPPAEEAKAEGAEAGAAEADGVEAQTAQPEEEPKSAEDQLKEKLRQKLRDKLKSR